MRWEDERYVRIFTRDTPSWDAMGWEAQSLLMLIFRKMDRTGLLALGNSGKRGLAACVRMPIDVVERALDVLLEDGVLTMSGKDIFCPNFMAAQECAKSDALRSREKRERAHLGLTQSVSREPQTVAQAPRSDTTAPQSDTPSVPSVPCSSLPKEECLSDAFIKIWSTYPNKSGKQNAWKAWKRIAKRVGEDRLAGIVSKQLEWQIPKWDSEKWHTPVMFSTYLNGKRWEDEKPKQSSFQAIYPKL